MNKIVKTGYLAVLAILGAITINAHAQTTPGRAMVRGLLGSVSAMTPEGQPIPLKGGSILGPGTTIRTGPRSAVDLFLGKTAGTIRLIENTTLVIKQFQLSDSGGQTIVEAEFELNEGTLLGKDSKITTATSHFEIKVPSGIAGISSGEYRISTKSYIVLLEGALSYVHVNPTGDMSPYNMKAPPAVYFSPVEGVRPAPTELVREVGLQFKSKLPK
ncbi:MAG TPA: hypothetical protein VGE41_11145 [Verrucomicrobiae bacterium]|jgi:hypothetical protein